MPLGKSNSYQSQSVRERKHFFHQEKPQVPFSALLSMKKYSSSSDRTDAIAASMLTCSGTSAIVQITSTDNPKPKTMPIAASRPSSLEPVQTNRKAQHVIRMVLTRLMETNCKLKILLIKDGFLLQGELSHKEFQW